MYKEKEMAPAISFSSMHGIMPPQTEESTQSPACRRERQGRLRFKPSLQTKRGKQVSGAFACSVKGNAP